MGTGPYGQNNVTLYFSEITPCPLVYSGGGVCIFMSEEGACDLGNAGKYGYKRDKNFNKFLERLQIL